MVACARRGREIARQATRSSESGTPRSNRTRSSVTRPAAPARPYSATPLIRMRLKPKPIRENIRFQILKIISIILLLAVHI
jgi:hypothetical protein